MKHLQHVLRRPAGHIIITDPEFGDRTFDTHKCVHCQYTWRHIPGSGRVRGFCRNCMGPVCGSPGCDECVPFQMKLGVPQGV